MILWVAVVSCGIGLVRGVEDQTFPPGFKFGVASAAVQVEGAWNASDKSENIWDRLTHTRPDLIADGSNGDVACDSYRLWRRDVEMIEEVGAHFYRFSLSWSRLLPNGFPNKISEDGVRYYNQLIDALLAKGIKPVVTIYHWDLPQSLQDLGGWTNPLISDWFADYARVVFSLFADRVNTWITINEPVSMCDVAYNTASYAPAIINPEVGAYLCNKITVIAHAKAWRIYDEEFKPKYQGEVSIANHVYWFEPESEADEELAELAVENVAGRYSHAIYSSTGGWPPSIEKVMAENSRKQGYPRTNLPPFTAEEIELVKGTYDFYALNHYTSRVIRPATEGEVLEPWPLGDAPDLNGKLSKHPDWETTQSSWYYINPEGLRRTLAWLKKQYGDIKFLITENGFPNAGGLNDTDRVDLYTRYLQQLLLAINEDKVDVVGYTAWTLMDNFEWMDGYSSKFGLYEVDFSCPNRTRTPRASAEFYADLIRTNTLQVVTNDTNDSYC